jgi:hypothetical protein
MESKKKGYWTGKKLTFPVWNKGLTKETDKRLIKSEETNKKHSEKLKGRIPKNLSLINMNKKDEDNPMWKGDNVLYRALHGWIMRKKVKQKLCSKCNQEKRLYLSNISGEYKRDINDYEWLCQSCHIKKDKGEIKLGIRIRMIDFYKNKNLIPIIANNEQ